MRKKCVVIIMACLCFSLSLFGQSMPFENGKGVQATTNNKYERIGPFNHGVAVVRDIYYCGVIDSMGNEIVPLTYSYIDDFRSGVARFAKDKRMGLMDIHGKEILPPVYQFIGEFFYERAPIRTEEACWGVIDISGKEIVPISANNTIILSFETGRAIINTKEGSGYVDLNGNISLSSKKKEISTIKKTTIRRISIRKLFAPF